MKRGQCMTCGATWAEDFHENHPGGEANVPDISYQMCWPRCHAPFTSGQYDAGINLSHDGPHTLLDRVWGLIWGLTATMALTARRTSSRPLFTDMADRQERAALGFGRLFNVLTPPAERPLQPVPDPFGRDHRNARFPGRGKVRPRVTIDRPLGKRDLARHALFIRITARMLRRFLSLLPHPDPDPRAEQLRAIEKGADTIAARIADLVSDDKDEYLLLLPGRLMDQHEPLLSALSLVRSAGDLDALVPKAARFIRACYPMVDFLVELGSSNPDEARAAVERLPSELERAAQEADRAVAHGCESV